MEIYLTSDHHFFHENIIKYCDRPFSSWEEMNKVMIERWNKTVGKGDIVVHLGDFSLGGPKDTVDVVNQLNGNIILIKGNHDRRTKTFWEKRAGFERYFRNDIVVSNSIILSHRPRRIEGVINLHGHVHNNLDKYYSEGCVNLSVDVWDYYPAHLDEIEILSKENKEDIKDLLEGIIYGTGAIINHIIRL
ncbi:MAG: phosphoesterase [Candidatus Stahlbacteria bacterium]|nr:MAG: phosphoesterase [Candidatus Stahlbacteria bacterium]